MYRSLAAVTVQEYNFVKWPPEINIYIKKKKTTNCNKTVNRYNNGHVEVLNVKCLFGWKNVVENCLPAADTKRDAIAETAEGDGRCRSLITVGLRVSGRVASVRGRRRWRRSKLRTSHWVRGKSSGQARDARTAGPVHVAAVYKRLQVRRPMRRRHI